MNKSVRGSTLHNSFEENTSVDRTVALFCFLEGLLEFHHFCTSTSMSNKNKHCAAHLSDMCIFQSRKQRILDKVETLSWLREVSNALHLHNAWKNKCIVNQTEKNLCIEESIYNAYEITKPLIRTSASPLSHNLCRKPRESTSHLSATYI